MFQGGPLKGSDFLLCFKAPWIPAKQHRPQTVPARIEDGFGVCSQIPQKLKRYLQHPATVPDSQEAPEEEDFEMGVKTASLVASEAVTQSNEKTIPYGHPRPTQAPEGVKEWNLPGHGDCGFRVLAALKQRRQSKMIETILAKVDKLAAFLRAKVAP